MRGQLTTTKHITRQEKVRNNPAMLYLLHLDSERSRKSMKSLLKKVANMVGHNDIVQCPWQELRRTHILAIKEQLVHSGLAPATVNTYLCALRGTAKEAWIAGLMSSDDYMKIKDVKSVRGSRLGKGRALNKEEVVSLLRVCQQQHNNKGMRDLAIISLLYGCGLRRAEVVSIEIQNINWHEQTIKITGKGNVERLTYLPESTLCYIKNWVDLVRKDDSGPLFTRIRRWDHVTKERLSDQAIYDILHNRQNEAGIQKCSPHDMRRTFGTSLLEKGVDIITVRDAMGHVSVTTTQKYDKRGNLRLRKASQLMND
ncbi:hypothetical protein N480_25425 [Pseudoalteromonas luteoviolacea S2607]|nr:hypothetical protein N480_25425 [Pseudoalteromonas luteoviolacea S2607]